MLLVFGEEISLFLPFTTSVLDIPHVYLSSWNIISFQKLGPLLRAVPRPWIIGCMPYRLSITVNFMAFVIFVYKPAKLILIFIPVINIHIAIGSLLIMIRVWPLIDVNMGSPPAFDWPWLLYLDIFQGCVVYSVKLRFIYVYKHLCVGLLLVLYLVWCVLVSCHVSKTIIVLFKVLIWKLLPVLIFW